MSRIDELLNVVSSLERRITNLEKRNDDVRNSAYEATSKAAALADALGLVFIKVDTGNEMFIWPHKVHRAIKKEKLEEPND